jgi:transcriptional regulator GlxA family with amidase domain
MATSTRKTVRIAVFVPSDVQLLDLACVDIFAVMGHQYLSELEMLPTSLTSLAPEISIAYVGTDKTVGLTAQTNLVVTHHLSDPEVGPGKFDIVVVPGPDPTASWGEDVKEWLGAQGREEKTEILSICTGIFLCGEAGLLKGRKASGPRGLQKMIEERFEGVELVGDRLRWVQDGNFWSCGEFVPWRLRSSFAWRGCVFTRLTGWDIQEGSRTGMTLSLLTPDRAGTFRVQSLRLLCS